MVCFGGAGTPRARRCLRGLPQCDAADGADAEGGGEERRAGITPLTSLVRNHPARRRALLFTLTVLIIKASLTAAMPHPVTGGSFVRLSEFPLFSPCPESGFTDTLQVVGSQRQFGRGRRHGPEETRQQCIENSREHGSGDDGDDRRGTLFSNPSFYMSAAEAGRH